MEDNEDVYSEITETVNALEETKSDSEVRHLHQLSQDHPSALEPYLGRVLKLFMSYKSDNSVQSPQNLDGLSLLVEICEFIREHASDETIRQHEDIILDAYDVSVDVEKMLLSGYILEIAEQSPSKLVERQYIIDELLRAPPMRVSTKAVKMLRHLSENHIDVVENFADKIFLIAQESQVIVEAEIAIELLASLGISNHTDIDDEELVESIRRLSSWEGNAGANLMSRATTHSGRLIINRPELAYELLEGVVLNLNYRDKKVQKIAGMTCLSIGRHHEHLFREHQELSAEDVALRIEQLNRKYGYAETIEDYGEIVDRIR